MSEKAAAIEQTRVLSLRRCLLTTLYHFFKAHPYANLELLQLSETCQSPAEDLNWNMVYLERCGLVTLIGPNDCPPFVACAACITVAGIDLIEDQTAFDQKFSITSSTKLTRRS